jgi:3-methyladenine DNA glycosylase AlkD
MTPLDALRAELRAAADPTRAQHSARLFKTGPGQYGAGDQFLGITVPQQRVVAKNHIAMPTDDVFELLPSPIHEERLTAHIILVAKYRQADPATRSQICDRYLQNTAHINNWDLVDSSAPYIVGPELDRIGPATLDRLATSTLVWDRRIAMLATAADIRARRFDRPLQVAANLVHDPEDLIHKAVGWMLREIGKHDLATEEAFLAKHYRSMPRTMLRSAIEKFPPSRRAAYMAGEA